MQRPPAHGVSRFRIIVRVGEGVDSAQKLADAVAKASAQINVADSALRRGLDRCVSFIDCIDLC